MAMAAQNTQNAPFFVDNEVIVIGKNGVWLADGVEISHDPTRRLFARSLKKQEDGYYLHIGRETKKVQVEDTAYFVNRIEGDSVRGYELVLSDESREKLNPETLAYKPGRLSCRVKAGTEEARFLTIAYFDLLRDLQENDREYFLKIAGVTVVLASKAGT
jgi:hypothetical protein